MGSERGKYVMSVELALQRETAYRNKLEALQLKQRTAPVTCLSAPRPPTTAQMPLPGPSRVPKTRLAPRPRLHRPPPISNPPPTRPLQAPRPPIYPSAAKPSFQSGLYRPANLVSKPVQWFPRTTHRYQGPRPFARAFTSQTTVSPSWKPTIRLTPPQVGVGHKRKEGGADHEEEVEVEGNENGGKLRKLLCEVCEVHCTSTANLRMHFMGQKHKAKLEKREEKDTDLYCELCGIWCINGFSYKQHLIGKNHITKLHVVDHKGERNK